MLKKLEDFTLPSGDAMLEKWIAALKASNKHLNAGDLKATSKVAHDAVPVLKGILPAIPDKIVHKAIEGLANQFEEKLANAHNKPISLAAMDGYFKLTAHTMLDAMSKTKPTAETLN